MEAAGRFCRQTTDNPGRRERRDNLYQPKEDGAERSSLPGGSRKTSLFLEAQMHPTATFLALAGFGLVLAQLHPAEARRGARPRRSAAPHRGRGPAARQGAAPRGDRTGALPASETPPRPVRPRPPQPRP